MDKGQVHEVRSGPEASNFQRSVQGEGAPRLRDLPKVSSPVESMVSVKGLSGVLPFQVRLITTASVGPSIVSTNSDDWRSAYFLGACHLTVGLLLDAPVLG